MRLPEYSVPIAPVAACTFCEAMAARTSPGEMPIERIFSGSSHTRIEYFISPKMTAWPTPSIRWIASRMWISVQLEMSRSEWRDDLTEITERISGERFTTMSPFCTTSLGSECSANLMALLTLTSVMSSSDPGSNVTLSSYVPSFPHVEL